MSVGPVSFTDATLPERPLTEGALVDALFEFPESSHLVVGEGVATRATALLDQCPLFERPKLAVRAGDDSDAWELF